MRARSTFRRSFATLSSQAVRGVQAKERNVAVLLHGLLGSKGNLQTFAKKLSVALPMWTIHLVDLRGHGDSARLDLVEGANTLARCCEDLDELFASLRIRPSVVAGHSFGGKVALQYATTCNRPLQVWTLDSWPGTMGSSDTDQVLRALRNTALPIQKKTDLVPFLESQGISKQIGMWMTTNLAESRPGKPICPKLRHCLGLRWTTILDSYMQVLGSSGGSIWTLWRSCSPTIRAPIDQRHG